MNDFGIKSRHDLMAEFAALEPTALELATCIASIKAKRASGTRFENTVERRQRQKAEQRAALDDLITAAKPHIRKLIESFAPPTPTDDAVSTTPITTKYPQPND